MRISLISDTHTRHKQIKSYAPYRKSNEPLDLPGGDLLIHAGDFMNSGWEMYEAREFFEWFDSISNYETKVFIAGNHDRAIQNEPIQIQSLLKGHMTIEYLQDEELVLYYDGPNGDFPEDNVRMYGSPWQPEFFNWAFNLPRNGDELKSRWDAIPENTDILITHGPPYGYLDIPGDQNIRVGCELLRYRVDQIKPKIHVFGHVHGSYGHYYNGHTHFFNASVLNERYMYSNLPFTFDWNKETNEIEFVNN